MHRDINSFIFRSYRPGDEVLINELFREVFNQPRGLDQWYWKYRDNPYGSYIIMLSTTSDGVIAAHYAGYPVKVTCCPAGLSELKEFTTYQLGDKMTRRHFRNIGFGKTSLIAKTYTHFKTAHKKPDIPFAYGFAANHSYRLGKLVLGYRDIEPVSYHRLDLLNLRELKRRRLKRFLSGISIENVTDVNKKWSDFFRSVAPFYKCLVKRDETYLRWRYLQRPDREYSIIALMKKSDLIGWSVFFRDGNRIIWGDALFQPQAVKYLEQIFVYLKGLPFAEGADEIECWFPPRPGWWTSALKRSGFTEGPEPHGIHFTLPIVYDESITKILKNNFYYTKGDSDLF